MLIKENHSTLPRYVQQNICIDSTNEPEEVSIALNPKSPNQMVAGANIVNFYFSKDTGYTWRHGIMKSPYGVYGDPLLLCDTAGSFYFFHLSNPPNGSWIDRMVCQKSTNGGFSWSKGSFVGLDSQKTEHEPIDVLDSGRSLIGQHAYEAKNQDKPGAVIDFSHSQYRNHIYLSWTEFDKYDSHKPGDSSRILFSQSDDAGISWTKPIRLDNYGGDCLDGDNTDEGAVPCVGPEGEVYDAWAGPEGLLFKRSFDGGKTWSEHEIKVAPIIGGWDYNVPGIFRSNGLPVTCCDLSNGPNRGTIYISWSDQRNGSDNTNIWFVRSTDKGETWSQPLRINNDTNTSQHFITWMTIDPVTGYLYSLFYDRREHKSDTTDVYMAVSTDGGSNFINFRVNDNSFVPTQADFFGDYISVTAYDGIVRPIWMQMNKHKLAAYTTIINPGDLDMAIYTPPGPLANNVGCEAGPNNSSVWFTFNLQHMEFVSLCLLDINGNNVYTIYTDKVLDEGDHEYVLDTKSCKLPAGVYCYKLKTSEGILYKPVLVY